jgi:hypothetical protein
MTQIGKPVPDEIEPIRQDIQRLLIANNFSLLDANSVRTGRDFLVKIWKMIVAVPLAIAVVHEGMPTRTQCNIYYEFGVAQTLGKETLLIKTKNTEIPSDFVRTEWIEYNADFSDEFTKYLDFIFERADDFASYAAALENDPLAAIDYLRRAYLITGNVTHRMEAKAILANSIPTGRAKLSVEELMANF